MPEITLTVSPKTAKRIADALLLRRAAGSIANQMHQQIAAMENEAQATLDAAVRFVMEGNDKELPPQYMVNVNTDECTLLVSYPDPVAAELNGVS